MITTIMTMIIMILVIIIKNNNIRNDNACLEDNLVQRRYRPIHQPFHTIISRSFIVSLPFHYISKIGFTFLPRGTYSPSKLQLAYCHIAASGIICILLWICFLELLIFSVPFLSPSLYSPSSSSTSHSFSPSLPITSLSPASSSYLIPRILLPNAKVKLPTLIAPFIF